MERRTLFIYKRIKYLIIILFFCINAFADGGAVATFPTKFEEEDGSPSVPATRKVIVDNGTITDEGNRIVRMTRFVSAPSYPYTSGSDGLMSFDANYLYVHNGTEWKRIAWGSWPVGPFALLLESGGYFLLESGDKLLLE